jgi:hypothetical protein
MFDATGEEQSRTGPKIVPVGNIVLGCDDAAFLARRSFAAGRSWCRS